MFSSVSRYRSSTLLSFYFGVSLLKLNSRKTVTLIIHGLLGNPSLGFRAQGLGFRYILKHGGSNGNTEIGMGTGMYVRESWDQLLNENSVTQR